MIRADGTAPLAAGLIFVGEMYGVQVDQLATVLEVTQKQAAAVAARWRAGGLAETGRLGPGQRWVWLTRAGLTSCGLPYAANAPGLSRLAHLRAVTAVRLALAATRAALLRRRPLHPLDEIPRTQVLRERRLHVGVSGLR